MRVAQIVEPGPVAVPAPPTTVPVWAMCVSASRNSCRSLVICVSSAIFPSAYTLGLARTERRWIQRDAQQRTDQGQRRECTYELRPRDRDAVSKPVSSSAFRRRRVRQSQEAPQ